MFLKVKNIGKIVEAEIEIAGITVIAGENNAGKSTLGEVLFCVFNTFHNPHKRIDNEKISSISRVLSRITDFASSNVMSENFHYYFGWDTESVSRQLIGEFSEKSIKFSDVRSFIVDSIKRAFPNEETMISELSDGIGDASRRVVEIVSVSDNELFRAALTRSLRREFSDQINNIFIDKTAFIELNIKGSASQIQITDNYVSEVSNILSLRTEAIYLDDPFVLDSCRTPYFEPYQFSHRHHLEARLAKSAPQESGADIERIVASARLDEIYEALNQVCEGQIVDSKNRGLQFEMPGTDKRLDARNLSSGLKTFAIIKHLLLNGVIEESGTIILDEPEIHLHPEWQVIFAKLIVMLQKEFGLHVLLNTHSPYFLNAIQVYARKYGVEDSCRYYQAILEGHLSRIEDVSGRVEDIYEKLAMPFQVLEDVAYGR